MTLQALTPDGTIHWQCLGGEEDEHCLTQLSAHIREAVYRLALEQSGPRGAMIDLPACHVCGAQRSLKADYTLKELFSATLTLVDASGGIIGYALELPHAHNLLIHHWLYSRGRAEHAPVLPLPTREEIRDPRLAALPGNVAIALWFGFAVVRERDPRLASFDMVLQELAALPTLVALPTAEREVNLGTSRNQQRWPALLEMPSSEA